MLENELWYHKKGTAISNYIGLGFKEVVDAGMHQIGQRMFRNNHTMCNEFNIGRLKSGQRLQQLLLLPFIDISCPRSQRDYKFKIAGGRLL